MSSEDHDNEMARCPKCGADMEWEACWQCFGEGEFDLHDEDPINFSPEEEFETCRECNGKGGYLVCQSCIAANKQKGR